MGHPNPRARVPVRQSGDQAIACHIQLEFRRFGKHRREAAGPTTQIATQQQDGNKDRGRANNDTSTSGAPVYATAPPSVKDCRPRLFRLFRIVTIALFFERSDEEVHGVILAIRSLRALRHDHTNALRAYLGDVFVRQGIRPVVEIACSQFTVTQQGQIVID